MITIDERIMWPAPQPQPTTVLRGGVVALTFDAYLCARVVRKLTRYPGLAAELAGLIDPEVLTLFDTFGAYDVKPKRGSRGVVWNNRPYWWSSKGFYRPGIARGARRPLQHYMWEAHHGRRMPAKHEIFFTDRDRHNFTIENMELLSKADVHRRTFELGETRSLSFEERSQIRGRWATTKSRDITALLLDRAQVKTTKKGESYGIITRLKERHQAAEV